MPIMRTLQPALVALAIITLSSPLPAAVPGGEALAGIILDQFDTNSDKMLDPGEWQGWIGASFGDLDGNGDGSIAADEVDGLKGDLASETGDFTAGLLVAIIKQVIVSLDTDKDKLVSRKEYDTLSNDVFDKLDADKNKSLTNGELADLPLKLIIQ